MNPAPHRNFPVYGVVFLIGTALIGTLSALIYPWGAFLALGLALAGWGLFVVLTSPYYVVLFLVFYMPLESFLTKFVPGPDQVFVVSQLASEALVYLLLVVVLARHILAGKPPRFSLVDILFVIFLGSAAISIIVNGASWVASLMNLRPMLRYVALFYVIIYLDLTEKQASQLLAAILIGGAFQLLLGLLQRIGGNPVKLFFAPRMSAVEVLGKSRSSVLLTSGREIGSVFGTLGDTLHYGIFISVTLVVYLSRLTKVTTKSLLVVAVLLVGIALSYARGVFFSSLVLIVIWYAIFHRPIYIPVIVTVGMVVLALLLMLVVVGNSAAQDQYQNPRQNETSVLSNITSIFSRDYLQRAKNQRLGAIIFVPPVVLREKPLFGYAPDTALAIERLSGTELPVIYRTLRESIFEDVYWVALLTYYGLVGFLTFVAIFLTTLVRAWRIHQQPDASPLSRSLAGMAFLMVTHAVFVLFFYRALEFRVFGFYLWLFAGLLFATPYLKPRPGQS